MIPGRCKERDGNRDVGFRKARCFVHHEFFDGRNLRFIRRGGSSIFLVAVDWSVRFVIRMFSGRHFHFIDHFL